MDSTVGTPIAQRLAAYLGHKAIRLQSCLDEALATGDAEAIHVLRVTSRRLHEPLWIVSTCRERRKVKRACQELKRIRRSFRRVRDLDVFLHSLSAPQGRSLAPEDMADLQERLSHQRAAALAAGLRRCRKTQPGRTFDALKDIGAAVAELNSAEWLSSRFTERLTRLARGVVQEDPRDDAEGDLHAARIRVKRLRYCAELCGRIGLRPMQPLVDQLTAMQDLLGRWNDDVAAGRRLARMAQCRDRLIRHPAWSARILEHAALRARAAADQRENIFGKWGGLAAQVKDGCCADQPIAASPGIESVMEDLAHV